MVYVCTYNISLLTGGGGGGGIPVLHPPDATTHKLMPQLAG